MKAKLNCIIEMQGDKRWQHKGGIKMISSGKGKKIQMTDYFHLQQDGRENKYGLAMQFNK